MGISNLDCAISGLFVSGSFAVLDVERGTVRVFGARSRLPIQSIRDGLE